MNTLLKNLTAGTSSYTSKLLASGRWWPQPVLKLYKHASFSTESSDPNSNSLSQIGEKNNAIDLAKLSPEELGLRKEDAFPLFAKPRGSGKKVYGLVPYKDGEMLADYVLFEDSIKKSEVRFNDYAHLTTDERDIYMAHLKAIEARRLSYVDPSTKKSVMTISQHLYRGECCGSGCRHCPYELENCSDEIKRNRKFNGSFYV